MEQKLTFKEQKAKRLKKNLEAYKQTPNAHPISAEILAQVQAIEEGRIKRDRSQYYSNEKWFCAFNGVNRTIAPQPHASPCYVLDSAKNIVARLEAKYLVRAWIYKQFGKSVTDKTAYRYFTSEKLYKGQFYFVPVEQYDEFMKK